MFTFTVTHKDAKSSARTGIIKTNHGIIHTPAFVPVGTAASVKSLTPDEIRATGTELFFCNTYHLYLRPGDKIIKKLGGLRRFMHWNGPIITDSGGFQVFSLAKNAEKKLVTITDDGVHFRSHIDGSSHFFTPERSIAIQKNLGADIMVAFDECAPFPTTKSYAKAAMERTHAWAIRSLAEFNRRKPKHQTLYGVVQGSVYRDLREQSARFIGNLPFGGIAIGGVSVGESKKQMRDVCDWVIPLLPDSMPRHMLGVGEIDDIFDIIEAGIDTFDCVMPTRLGRMGHVLTAGKTWKLDITKTKFKTDNKPIDTACRCYTCQRFSRAYINHLFKCKELLAYRLASYHNVFFLQQLVSQIRRSITDGNFLKIKKKWLGKSSVQ